MSSLKGKSTTWLVVSVFSAVFAIGDLLTVSVAGEKQMRGQVAQQNAPESVEASGNDNTYCRCTSRLNCSSSEKLKPLRRLAASRVISCMKFLTSMSEPTGVPPSAPAPNTFCGTERLAKASAQMR